MKIILISYLLLNSSFAAVDFGTGADGNCVFNADTAQTDWNCDDVIVTANTRFTGATAVTIKARGTVTVNTGVTLSVSASGSIAVAGGSDGGPKNCTAAPCSTPNSDATGTLAGKGQGGSEGVDGGAFTGAGGGGGAGGTYSSTSPGQSGDPGTGGGGTPGAGGVANTTGYGAESQFQTTMPGGVGGGAGGSSEDDQGNPAPGSHTLGGAGGGGGGVLKIFAQDAILVNGTVASNGGNGGNGANLGGNPGGSGGGGGGSGGAIFIYTASTLTVNGAITATGGSGGLGDNVTGVDGGDGGDGGVGRIRLDTLSGAVTGVANVNPTPVVGIADAIATSTGGETFTSDIAANCALTVPESAPAFILIFMIALGLTILLPRLVRRHPGFRYRQWY